MFRTVPLPIMSFFQDRDVPILLASYQQTCMTYTTAVCTVKNRLMMDGETLRNMLSFIPKINLRNSAYRTIILPVVLYGCETWSLIFREERKLTVFENMMLRIIFGPRRDEVTGEWRRLHKEELNDLYSSPNIVRVKKSRRMRWAGHVARMGEETGVYRVLVGKPEGRNYWGDLGVDGRIILEWISRRWDVCIWTGLGWPRIQTGGGRL